MTIQFKSGQVLFISSSVAMDVACCCPPPCDCTGPLSTVGCTSCLDADYSRTPISPRANFEFSISGVTTGATTGCFGDCSTYIATHTAFFNGTFTIPKCTGVTYQECIDLGCSYSDGFGTKARVEWNRLTLGVFYSGGWTGSAVLTSWVVDVAVNAFNPDACVNSNPGESGDPIATIISKRVHTYLFARSPGTRPSYQYDTTACPPESCDNIEGLYIACIPEGWDVTATTNSGSETSCKGALNVSGATITLTSL